jgi:teichuronic acid biosynthesis glycosyltransferase TuaC
MKVLFVSSGNSKEGISPIVKNQGQSLIKQGVDVVFFTIKGRGLKSYFHHIFILKKYLKTNKFDIIHAHYSLSAYVAALAGARPLIASLMGSDVKLHKYTSTLVPFFYNHFWNQTIVKSKDMYQHFNLRGINIIPNGVDIDRFISLDKRDCQNKLSWDINRRHIIFVTDPDRVEKNFSLAKMAIGLIQKEYELVLHIVKDVPNENIPVYLNAADVLILSSLHEGSPNVIKEAMSCNCPIVSTDVGDVCEVIGDTSGCYICSFDPEDVADKIKEALMFSQIKGRTDGRDRIINLELDSENIAKKILNIYNRSVYKS